MCQFTGLRPELEEEVGKSMKRGSLRSRKSGILKGFLRVI